MDKNEGKNGKKIIVGIAAIVVVFICIGIVYLAETSGHKSDTKPVSSQVAETVKSVEVTAVQEPETTTETETEPETEEQRFVVCLDAGHGGNDEGTNIGNRVEKDEVLALAKIVEEYLTSQGIDVIMTRSGDDYMSPEERYTFANERKADLLVSLHRNSSDEDDGYGVETWVNVEATEEELFLAENIMNDLESVGIQKNRGVRNGSQTDATENYKVNNFSDMPSCLIELGFINNAKDNELWDTHLEEYGRAIGDAIIKTKNQYPGAGGNDTQEETEPETEPSQVVENTIIPNVESLDASVIEYGHGNNVDENNRPYGATNNQEQYGDAYNSIFIKEADSKVIYLTFDEGYENGYTDTILDTLKAKDVKATFFVLKLYAEEAPDKVQRIIDEGHTLGNHSATHPSAGMPSETIEEQMNEVMETDAYIKENFGYTMHYFRFPAGIFSEQSLAIVNNCNYTSVFWSFAYYDYDVNNQPDQAESLQKLINKLHPGAVYLLHAESATNAAILGDFIDAARAAGYEFRQLE